MSNRYEKLVEQQARLKQKIEREDFKLRQSKYYENRQARKARSRRLIQRSSPKCWCKLNSANLSFHKLKHTGFF